MFTSAIKKQTSVCCSISLNPYYGISNLESLREKRKKESNYIVSFAHVSCMTIARFICKHCL